MQYKTIIKNMITFFRHPILVAYLSNHGTRNIYIGSRLTLNDRHKIKIGKNVYIGNDARFLIVKRYHGGVYNPQITIEDGVTVGNRFSALSAEPIIIKKNSLIASDVLITSENHGVNPELSESYALIPLEAASVEIGEGVWIGEKVSILPGVTIGERSIVAAGAVVNKNVPPYTMVGGVPAKVIKKYDFETHQWMRVNKDK